MSQVKEAGEYILYEQCYRDISPISINDDEIRVSLKPDADRDLPNILNKVLQKASGQNLAISVSNDGGGISLYDKDLMKKEERFLKAQKDEIIGEILKQIPGAKLVEVKEI